MSNSYSEEERQQLMMACCFKATCRHFSHLPMRLIISPPVTMFDAFLARQVALHILHTEFGVPRRRIVAMTGIVRATMLMAVRTVDYRLEEPVFARTYGRIAARAKDLFMLDIHKEAA